MNEINQDKAIKATYEDAIRYLDRAVREGAKEVTDRSEGAEGLLAGLVYESVQMGGAIRAVAFCYGVSETQVSADLIRMKGEARGR